MQSRLEVLSTQADGPFVRWTARKFADREGGPLARALRNQSLWLVITYIGLLLLIARGYE